MKCFFHHSELPFCASAEAARPSCCKRTGVWREQFEQLSHCCGSVGMERRALSLWVGLKSFPASLLQPGRPA